MAPSSTSRTPTCAASGRSCSSTRGLHLRLPDRARRPRGPLRGVPEARRRDLLGVDRHPLHAQGVARHLRTIRRSTTSWSATRPARSAQLRGHDRGLWPGRPRHLRRRPRRQIQILEVNAGGVGPQRDRAAPARSRPPVCRVPPGRGLPRESGKRATPRSPWSGPRRQRSDGPPALQDDLEPRWTTWHHVATVHDLRSTC